jgi:hypothetical protein
MSVDRVPEVAVGTDEPLARSARMHAGWLQLALSISGVILIKMKWFIGIKFWCPGTSLLVQLLLSSCKLCGAMRCHRE